MADEHYSSETYCGRCGQPFPGGGVGNCYCAKCFSDLRRENSFPEDPAKQTPENPQKELGSSGFRTL